MDSDYEILGLLVVADEAAGRQHTFTVVVFPASSTGLPA